MTFFDAYKEEDEGYFAAKSGQALSANPYPRGTIRHKQWQQGWRINRNERQNQENEGYQAADAEKSLSENPHPPGTIRYVQWRDGWHIKRAEERRLLRLGACV